MQVLGELSETKAVTIANDFEGREVVSLGFFFEN